MTVSGLRFYHCVKQGTSWNFLENLVKSQSYLNPYNWFQDRSIERGETLGFAKRKKGCKMILWPPHIFSNSPQLFLWTSVCHALVNKIEHLNHWGKTGSILATIKVCALRVINMHGVTVCICPLDICLPYRSSHI